VLVKDVMTRKVVGVLPRATVAEALDLMVRSHVSGLPVIDEAGSLVGIVSEGDFLRRSELGRKGPSVPGSRIFSFQDRQRKPTGPMDVTSMKS
jgi:CBS domain-containing protein